MVRKYKPLTDDEILELLRHGIIWIVGGTVYSRSRECTEYRCHRGYRHIRIYWNGARRSVAKHKLIWMAANGRVVPPGCEVHHAKGKACELPADLELLGQTAHRELHRENGYPSDWDDDF